MACAGGKVEQFSATQVTILANGKEVSRHTMNVTPDKVRLEIDAPMEKGMLIMILRKDKGTQWVINPESKTYFERFLKENEWDRALRRDLKVEEENLGTDEVSGFTCTKRRVETTFGMMGRTMTSKATVWVSERIGMPLRTAQENGQVVELRDIKPGRQAGELFEVPEGFEKAENMMKVLGGQSRRQDGGGRKGLRGTLGM
jgi:outer membrane lipoprotein-sorting protein